MERKGLDGKEKKRGGGMPGLVIIGVSMAAGFLLSSFLSSRRSNSIASSRRRYKDSRYDMDGRW